MIAAVSQNGVIGINNKIPWYCSADFQHFKKTTFGNIVVMGRKTYDSLFDHMKDKSKEPLPGRVKVVITSSPNSLEIRNNVFAFDVDDVESFLKKIEILSLGVDVFVIGGEQIYKLFEGYYHDIYLTRIDCNYTGERIDDVVSYLPIKDSVLMRDYELLYTLVVENDPDTKTPVRYEQWRVRNSFGM